MRELEAALERLPSLDPQVDIEVVRGVFLRRKENGIPVLSIHYSADPDRDPETPAGAEWFAKARGEYSSQSGWDREQEMDALAGGGERVFARVLGPKYHDAVVITDPKWMPDPRWDTIRGFDHGKTNAVALEQAYIDFQGNVYFCGEYYSMAREGWVNDVANNAPEMLKMPGKEKMRWCMADPSIFPDKDLQKDGTYSSVNKTYRLHGITWLTAYEGERSDLTFVERILSDYWHDLDNKKPRLFIVCRNESERIQPGLHPYDCPNLLWELNRAKRAQLSARQMLTRNPTENIVDKFNHCLAAGTLVESQAGPRPIEHMRAGDQVWTRQGWRRVIKAWCADPAAVVYRITFSNGTQILATGNHPVWIKGIGFVRTDALKRHMICECLSTDRQRFARNAQVSIVEVSRENLQLPVYDLTVEGAEEFFANGILVHNSRDAMKYMIFRLKRPTAIPLEDQMQAQIAGLNPTSAAIAAQRFYAEHVKKQTKTFSYRRKARMR